MNLKYINRKQKLGISNPSDFDEWALKLDKESVKRSDDVCKLIHGLFDYNGGGWLTVPTNHIELNIHPTFNALISKLGLEFQHLTADDTAYTKAVQSIHADASNDIQLLDKMMVECGCNSIGDDWIEYSSEDGKKTLKTAFKYEVRPMFTKARSYDENTLVMQGKIKQGKPLQSLYETDFGLVIRDDQNIGFLLLARDHY